MMMTTKTLHEKIKLIAIRKKLVNSKSSKKILLSRILKIDKKLAQLES